MPKISREKFKVYGNVFDNHSLRNIFKLSSEGYFEELKSPIQIGKEANVFSAIKKDKSLVIVKIYRVMNCNFNKMYEYINADRRYVGLKKQRRKIIFAWTQREYRNLLKAHEAQVTSPIPFTFKDNIIVMEYVGDNMADSPAPQLKDCPPENPQPFFELVVENMRRLHSIGIVHADLSKFNILNHNELPYFIDFSQSLPIDEPNALEYLKRDVKNICTYFKKLRVDADEQKTFEKIVSAKSLKKEL